MYKPSQYNNHNQSMSNFCNLFNSCKNHQEIIMLPIEEETFLDDGYFYNKELDTKIGFDWEYRVKYFKNGVFAFDSLGQYERKIIKPSIQLSIQCDSTQTAILVAWHNDFYNEVKTKLNLETEGPKKQFGTVRYTKNFKIYMYEDLNEFKEMLYRAFQTNTFDSSAF